MAQHTENAPRPAPAIQRKPVIGAADDPLEREADLMADRVMRMPDPAAGRGVGALSPAGPAVRRVCTECKDELRRKTLDEDEAIRPKAEGGSASGPSSPRTTTAPASGGSSGSGVSGGAEAAASAVATGGHPLSPGERSFFEPRFGRDFSSVRVHDGARAGAAARGINARAYTLGANIAFAPGQYAPHTNQGRRLMAHELAHVGQQQTGLLSRLLQLKETPLQQTDEPDFPPMASIDGECIPDKKDCSGNPSLAENPDWPISPLLDHPRLHKAHRNTPTLKKNKWWRYEAVERVQMALLRLCYSLPASIRETGEPDGIFGDETESTIKQFQRDQCLNDDGEVGHNTLDAMDDLLSQPKILLNYVTFRNDHRLLIHNRKDWTYSGLFYAPGNTPHVNFERSGGWGVGTAVPMSVTAGETLSGTANVTIRGGAPGVPFILQANNTDDLKSFSFEGSGWVAGGGGGSDTRSIPIRAKSPTARLIHELSDTYLMWKSISRGREDAIGYSGEHVVFFTAGRPFRFNELVLGDYPNAPTHVRMQTAIEWADGSGPAQMSDIASHIMKFYPFYGPLHPALIWSISDTWGAPYQCIIIARYLEAVLNVLGFPSKQNTSVDTVVVWPDPEKKRKFGRADPLPPARGLPDDPIYRHATERWHLGLIDKRGRANNFEACTRLEWDSPQGRQVQFFCGGARNPNDAHGSFQNETQILKAVFDGLYYVEPLPPTTPPNVWPTAILHECVERYDGGVCPKDET